MPANSNQGPSSVSAVSPAFAISVNYLWISHLMNFGLRTRELTSLLLTPIYGQGWVRMLSNGGRLAPLISTFAHGMLLALPRCKITMISLHTFRLAVLKALLQETNWTLAQPATLTTAHPHINIAASNLPPDQTGSGGVCILPPLGWTQIEHTEIIPGFLQDALYDKYGAQVRVINVYVHPARTKEVGARLISHLAHISDSCVVLGGDFNQLPNTPMWADLVAHFSCVSPKLTTYLSGGIGSALDRLFLRHPMVDNDSARVTYHVRWPVTRPSQHGALWGTLKVASSISPSPK